MIQNYALWGKNKKSFQRRIGLSTLPQRKSLIGE